MVNYNGKPYHSLDYHLREVFHDKVYKIALDAGTTCPNRDGKIDTRGCIFCSLGGSGDFASSRKLSITSQIESGIRSISEKYNGHKFIAYFQAFTGTYGDKNYLRECYLEAIRHPDIVCLSIATRPDCIDEDILKILDECNHIKPVWIELGLQTINEDTASYIRRGYPLSVFDKAVRDLRSINIDVIVHTIIGLPGETFDDMKATICYLAKRDIQGIKLQLLHVLKGTDLLTDYENGLFQTLSLEEYTDIIIRLIELLPENIVIHRITGDGPKSILVSPTWSSNKKYVLNYIHKEFKLRGAYQGKYYRRRF